MNRPPLSWLKFPWMEFWCAPADWSSADLLKPPGNNPWCFSKVGIFGASQVLRGVLKVMSFRTWMHVLSVCVLPGPKQMDEKILEITACNNLKIFILDSVGTSGISLNSTSNLAHLESSIHGRAEKPLISKCMHDQTE